MNTNRSILIAIVISVTSTPVYSGTVVESKDQDGKTSTTRIEGNKIRTDTGEAGIYVIFNLDKNKAYVVDESEKMVMDMSESLLGETQDVTNSAANREGRLVEQGKGPTIAGYSTVHYKAMVGDMHCGDEYLSSKSLKDANLKRFGETMSKMSRSQEKMMGGVMGMGQDPCDMAEHTMFDVYLKKGMPMRSVDKNGTLEHEILSIKTNVTIPARSFELPKGYPIMTMEQMMQQHTMMQEQQMRNMPPMPDMSNMNMDDMNKMREQVEQQMQEMMRQMGKAKQ